MSEKVTTVFDVKEEPATTEAGGWAYIQDGTNQWFHFFRNRVALCGSRVLLKRHRYEAGHDGDLLNCPECTRLRRQTVKVQP